MLGGSKGLSCFTFRTLSNTYDNLFISCFPSTFWFTRASAWEPSQVRSPTMKLAKCLAILLALAVSVGSAQLLLAQGTDLGTIRGTVTDPSGAVVANASVTIADQATGALRHTETNPHGEYQMFGLPSGTYKVTIAAPGMTASNVTGIVLTGSDTVNANAVLKISTASESV